MRSAVCASAASLALFAAIAPALATPALTLAPALGPPTTRVTVTASGFPSATAVDIFFDVADTCLALTNGAGTASCVVSVPRDAQPQLHWITALVHGGASGAQKAFTVRTDMPQFHGRNARHVGVNPFENTINVGNAGDLDLLWSVVGPAPNSSPVVAGGNVYVGSVDGKLYAFNAVNGAPVAGFPVQAGNANSHSGPAVGGGRVFIGADDGVLYGFNAATGAAVSGFPAGLGGKIWSTPALAFGNVYVGANGGSLWALNAATGATVTGFPVSTNVGSAIFGSPTIAGNKVFVGTGDANLYAFNAATGAAAGGFPIATAGVGDTMAAMGSDGYFGTASSNLYGFRLSDGTALGGFPVAISTSTFSSPAVAGGNVIVGSSDGKLHATNLSGGSVWTTTLDSDVSGSPMVANGVVYVQTTSRLYVLAQATGSILWSTGVSSAGSNSPVVANGIVYAVDNFGTLSAYSVNGLTPAARLPGGALGVKPALSALHPNPALKIGQPVLPPSAEE